MSKLNSQLMQTMRDYRQGSAKPSHPQGNGDLFNQKLQMLMMKRLPLKDQLLLRRYDNARAQGLLAARRGQVAIAEQSFTEAQTPLFMDTLSREGKLLHQVFLEQAAAYLDYSRQDFEQVYSRTHKALGIDVILEEEYGYEILLINRIQLMHNLVRTEARRQNCEQAISLAFQLLAYLNRQIETLPTPHPWGSKRIARQPSELVAAMFAQVTGEVALMMTSSDRAQMDYLRAAITTKQRNSCHPRAEAWLLVKQSFVIQDFSTFLAQAGDFLAEGRGDTPILWYTTVIDLLAVCNELSELDLSQEILADVATWQDLPHKLHLAFAQTSINN
jgi:hypothetical protein